MPPGGSLKPYSPPEGSAQVGEPDRERRALFDRFADRLLINVSLNRRSVSYQGNRYAPGFRWMRYKEGFSTTLVERLVALCQPATVLDPFAGIGTAPLVAGSLGVKGCGIEIMPVGVMTSRAIAYASNELDPELFTALSRDLIDHVTGGTSPLARYRFRHVPITESAFPRETEVQLARARQFVDSMPDEGTRLMLEFAVMSVLESASFTRKDGQYLRWDHRSGRTLRSQVTVPITPFAVALQEKLAAIVEDVPALKRQFGAASTQFLQGSILHQLPQLPDKSIDMVITSPPYANRYDYTRTYALELAWLGYDRPAFAKLRQQLLTATVENKSKRDWLLGSYSNPMVAKAAIDGFESQAAVQEVLQNLNQRRSSLSNPHIIRLIEGYCLEMAVIVAELARVLAPGGMVAMVNDNVQYEGEELPVDLILSDYAETFGLTCNCIWVLPRGKGNSSQQMGRFGRRELRKCVYLWTRRHDRH